MKITEIIQLLKAGYTKAEISELREAETIVDTPKDISVPTEEPEADPAPAPAGPDPEIAELKNMVQNLQKLVQTQNIKSNVRESAKPETAVDILASVINGSKHE